MFFIRFSIKCDFAISCLTKRLLPETYSRPCSHFSSASPIVDEVDSILIDEARTPLVISGQSDSSVEIYPKINSIIKCVKKNKPKLILHCAALSRPMKAHDDNIKKISSLWNVFHPTRSDGCVGTGCATPFHRQYKINVRNSLE